MTRCQIALGGNVGDVPATFAAALGRLDGTGLRVVAVSRLYATPAMGAEAGEPFLNAAATVETSLEPLGVLERLLAEEEEFGRVRSIRWGPRPIDLDLVFYGDAILELPRLRVPHPGCWYRRFVLDPLAEIAGEVAHPETGESVAALRERLLSRPLGVAFDGPSNKVAEAADAMARVFPEIVVVPVGEGAALTIVIGSDVVSAGRRTIGVRADAGLVEAAESVLTAALGEAEVVEDRAWRSGAT